MNNSATSLWLLGVIHPLISLVPSPSLLDSLRFQWKLQKADSCSKILLLHSQIRIPGETCLVMVCSSLIRSVIVQAAHHIGVFSQGRRINLGFGISAEKMSVESSRISMVDMPPHKVDDGGYIGGGWKK
ncbi:unnamed protein product [Eruca vesicaria subsp. sativa]|uniref:Uncharacterized protein n=1 Tax=Eruca vesicaria subsp. sativa TaxID=29727 RepID=A0ABC8IQB0_ERUVS|nr:unnamed protein product [Eruca vesicaria subsp. sativa]